MWYVLRFTVLLRFILCVDREAAQGQRGTSKVYCAYALVSQPARVQVLVLIMAALLVLLCVHANVNVNNLVAISMFNFDISGEPGQKAKRVIHLETPSDNCT